MDFDIKTALKDLRKYVDIVEHEGRTFSRLELAKILTYCAKIGLEKGSKIEGHHIESALSIK